MGSRERTTAHSNIRVSLVTIFFEVNRPARPTTAHAPSLAGVPDVGPPASAMNARAMEWMRSTITISTDGAGHLIARSPR
jgi:hypothetical protein